MHVIRATDADEALWSGLELLSREGVQRGSRNGQVLMVPTPVMTVNSNPSARVLGDPCRDANPFFHLAEALWMLQGRDSVEFLARYVSRMREYSDDGSTLHGAYGKRWRSWFRVDQLTEIITNLRANPEDRRCVIGMWDPSIDLRLASRGGKDVPCNTHAYVSVKVTGDLDLTVCCRSNDAIWGAHGANLVHFSILLEYLAAATGHTAGTLYQLSNNYHAYTSVFDSLKLKYLQESAWRCATCDRMGQPTLSLYDREEVCTTPLLEGPDELACFHRELQHYLEDSDEISLREVHAEEYHLPFFRSVAVPMMQAHRIHKLGRTREAREMLEHHCTGQDWLVASTEWLERREKK